MVKILHITPHLGGGVGTVLLNWLAFDKNNKNSIVTLDFANKNGKKVCKDNDIPLFSQPQTESILELIKKVDIVLVHFWNHPLLYDFLIRNELPKSRLIIWSHISGAEPPYVFPTKILHYPDLFVFTTSISTQYAERKINSKVILSSGGLSSFSNTQSHHSPKDFTVGYIGTVDYAKMHPKYIEINKKTSANKFIIVGGDKQDEIALSADSRFLFTGKVSDIHPYLDQMDVFGYLLNPKHYGTAEQVLQEVMHAGVVPVVLNNPCERSLVMHMKTGLIANSLEEYVSFVELLKNDDKLRTELSENAKQYAKEHFSLSNMIIEWNSTFEEIMQKSKTSKKWNLKNSNRLSSYDIFTESLGSFAELFTSKKPEEIKHMLKESNWQSDTKGTPKQYYHFLGGTQLKSLCDLYE